MNKCITCQVDYYTKSKTSVCCSQHCRVEYKYKKYIELWLEGKMDGKTKGGNIVEYIRRYFREKYYNSCSACQWNEKNPFTGEVPLEIDHINGDKKNNSINNLRILCPNCHSLTPTYKGRNTGLVKAYKHILHDPAYSKHLYKD